MIHRERSGATRRRPVPRRRRPQARALLRHALLAPASVMIETTLMSSRSGRPAVAPLLLHNTQLSAAHSVPPISHITPHLYCTHLSLSLPFCVSLLNLKSFLQPLLALNGHRLRGRGCTRRLILSTDAVVARLSHVTRALALKQTAAGYVLTARVARSALIFLDCCIQEAASAHRFTAPRKQKPARQRSSSRAGPGSLINAALTASTKKNPTG